MPGAGDFGVILYIYIYMFGCLLGFPPLIFFGQMDV